MIKAKAVGLNPTDWKSIHGGDAVGKKIGVCIGLVAPRQPFSPFTRPRMALL